MKTHKIPRKTHSTFMYIGIPDGVEIPVLLRDDLDPYAPPLEYADGRISWSGYSSQEERNQARILQREGENRESIRLELQRELQKLRSAHRNPLGYRVCTFGSPSRLSEPDGEHGLYRSPMRARLAAQSSVGSGSCTNAIVAVIYESTADPDISQVSGRGWEWLSKREVRGERMYNIINALNSNK